MKARVPFWRFRWCLYDQEVLRRSAVFTDQAARQPWRLGLEWLNLDSSSPVTIYHMPHVHTVSRLVYFRDLMPSEGGANDQKAVMLTRQAQWGSDWTADAWHGMVNIWAGAVAR